MASGPSEWRGALPVWAPAAAHARHVLLRPAALQLHHAAARLELLVSAAPDDAVQQRVLATYRLFVNSRSVGIGPGRTESSLKGKSNHGVFDRFHISADSLRASNESSLCIALHCFHQDGQQGAWAMLLATVLDAANRTLQVVRTGSDWFAYNADSIWKQGEVDSGSAYKRVNEDIDGGAQAAVYNWKTPQFDPSSSWERAESRSLAMIPMAKTTAPLALRKGLLPVSMVQLSADHYFFDFGQERMSGIVLSVPKPTVVAWGGEGTTVEIKLSEQLSEFNKHAVLFPDFSPGCVECSPLLRFKKIPKIISRFYLAEADQTFEHHEYPGVWRYGELRIFSSAPLDPQAKLFTVSSWAVAYPWQDEAGFECQSAILNRVWQLGRDTIKYTSLDTFTDSNVRERTPYEADGHHTVQSYWALSSDRAWPRHSIQFVLNNPTWPTEWKQFTVLMVYAHYMQSGDLSLARQNFELLVNNTMLPYIHSSSDLVNFSAILAPPECAKFEPSDICNSPLCHFDTATYPEGVNDGGKSCDIVDWLPKMREGFKFTPVNTVVNSFAVHGIKLMSKLADALGMPEQATKLASQAERTRHAMIHAMYQSDGKWCDGPCSRTTSTTFHAQHFPLWLGITPDAGVQVTFDYLRRAGLRGSTYSAYSIVHGLYDRAAALDHGQTAFELMTQCEQHSWCAMLRGGATTTWEHWSPHDGTHSHPWSTTPVSAIASGLMGIRPIIAGWKKWIIKPAPGNLSFAKITLPTVMGPIQADFSHSQNRLNLDLTIPTYTKAIVCMPLFGAKVSEVVLTLDDIVVQGRLEPQDLKSGAYLCLDEIGSSPRAPKRSVSAALSSDRTRGQGVKLKG